MILIFMELKTRMKMYVKRSLNMQVETNIIKKKQAGIFDIKYNRSNKTL